MNTALSATRPLMLIQSASKPEKETVSLLRFMDLLGITDVTAGPWIEKLPFALQDATAGTENELQVAVAGSRQHADLAQTIETSGYFKNIVTRVASGDAPEKTLSALENYLGSSDQVWENSWVRFPLETLNPYAKSVLENDLLADKQQHNGPQRGDSHRFFLRHNAKTYLRIPISYLLKVSLAQVIGRLGIPAMIRETGEKMLGHFLNDNTSPETHSFFPISAQTRGLGQAVAEEILLRYLLTQLLVQYANKVFELETNGQQPLSTMRRIRLCAKNN